MSESHKTLTLTTRHWRLYNPDEYSGPVDMEREFLLEKTAFVPLHIWNVGFPDGPEYPRDRFAMYMCTPEDTVIMRKVVEDTILPCLETARGAGMTICHVELERIANKYPIGDCLWEPKDLPPYAVKWTESPEDLEAQRFAGKQPEVHAKDGWVDPLPGWWLERADLVHGPGHRDWEGGAILDRPESCKPLTGEYVIKTSAQFDRILRSLKITNLIYVGFTTQGCVLHSEGAISAMSDRGYRCLLIREGTHGVEYPDTRSKRLMTKLAIRHVEYRYGFSIGAQDFIQACEKASGLK